MSINKLMLVVLLWPMCVWAGDPTRPPNLEAPITKGVAQEPLRLSMILSDQGRKRAVVNGKVLSVAERIGDARVVAIQDDYVVMARAGQQFVLRMPVHAIKQASEGEVHE